MMSLVNSSVPFYSFAPILEMGLMIVVTSDRYVNVVDAAWKMVSKGMPHS